MGVTTKEAFIGLKRWTSCRYIITGTIMPATVKPMVKMDALPNAKWRRANSAIGTSALPAGRRDCSQTKATSSATPPNSSTQIHGAHPAGSPSWMP